MRWRERKREREREREETVTFSSLIKLRLIMKVLFYTFLSIKHGDFFIVYTLNNTYTWLRL